MQRLAIVVVGVCACSHAAPSKEELLRDAQDETRRFFALAEAGDCEQLKPLLAHPDRCAEMVEEFRVTHTHLSSVTGAEVDGRDPHVVLVTVDAPALKHEHTWVLRVQWTADGWKVSL